MEIVRHQICAPGVTNRSATFAALALVAALAGCMPLAADDFSVLDNDVLSDLLRKSYSDINLTPGHSSGSIGVGRIDRLKFNSLASELFVGQDRNKIEEIFWKNRGQCAQSVNQEVIVCNFIREWKLKNIGGSFDTSNWSNPEANIEIAFLFNTLGRARTIHSEIINITKYKVIKG
ncbi:hypothetical protein [Massilia pseudoviolaceinigra]|uniref:hypothetical protein n=1 Tax=Massilia pseudoviolaceinigra TaxID=3057165 RepID=UPI002796AC0F|nr:hypothetical protein [Massilia sp. CCM 9206]MDQ1920709.1 hypothetical protein [Massilia sp. CCM 9206]